MSTSPIWGLAIVIIIFVVGVFDAVNTGATSSLPVLNDIEAITENEPLTSSDLGGPDLGIELPTIAPSAFRFIMNAVTWNHSFFTQEWQMFRIFFIFVSWGVVLWQFGFLQPLVTLGSFMVELIRLGTQLFGGAVGVLRSIVGR